MRDLSSLVQARSGYATTWLADDEAAKNAQAQVSELLRSRLTLDSAIRVALLSNKTLQASYEELGIAQADLVQAGLLKNPTLGATYRFSLDEGHGPGIELNLVTNLVQLLTMGSRKSIARVGLEAAKFRVADEVLRQVYEVKLAYFAMQGAQQTYAMRQIVTDAARAALELSRRQHEAGTISDLDLANEEVLFAEIFMETTRSRAELTTAREHLNRALGVWGANTGWSIDAKLDELPAPEIAADRLEMKAMANRLDMRAAHKDVEVIAYALSLAKNTRWFGGVDAGVSFERKPERISLIGPTVSVEIPIFDQRQAAIARIEAQLRQARARESALAVNARSEVRTLAAQLEVARAVAEQYQRSLVPLRERIVALSQQQYDGMLLGVFQLIAAKRGEISTYRELIDALRAYWTLRAELEWKTGGSLRP